MQDKELERKINDTRDEIRESDLHPLHKEALKDSLDQAEASANGSQEKLHDLTVAFCKSVIRSARSDISFKSRVTEAVQPLLENTKDEIVTAVAALLKSHVIECPNKAAIQQPKPETTWKDVLKTAVTNKWFCIAVAVVAFSPNIVGIIELFTHK